MKTTQENEKTGRKIVKKANAFFAFSLFSLPNPCQTKKDEGNLNFVKKNVGFPD
jgi:hypothetical protein